MLRLMAWQVEMMRRDDLKIHFEKIFFYVWGMTNLVLRAFETYISTNKFKSTHWRLKNFFNNPFQDIFPLKRTNISVPLIIILWPKRKKNRKKPPFIKLHKYEHEQWFNRPYLKVITLKSSYLWLLMCLWTKKNSGSAIFALHSPIILICEKTQEDNKLFIYFSFIIYLWCFFFSLVYDEKVNKCTPNAKIFIAWPWNSSQYVVARVCILFKIFQAE